MTPNNRVSFSYQPQYRCLGSTLTANADGCRVRGADWIGSPPARRRTPPRRVRLQDGPVSLTQATWTSPMSSRHLVDAAVSRFWYAIIGNGDVPPDAPMGLVGVTEARTSTAGPAFVPRPVRVGRIRHRLVELARLMVVCDRRAQREAGLHGTQMHYDWVTYTNPA